MRSSVLPMRWRLTNLRSRWLPTAKFRCSERRAASTAWEIFRAPPSSSDGTPYTTVPLWQGESLAGKVLALLHEQGLGDSLQFIRYLPAVAQRAAADGGRVVFQPPESLYRLFATSFADYAHTVTIFGPDE